MSGAEFALGTLPVSIIPQTAIVPPAQLMQVDYGTSASALQALGHTLGGQAAHGLSVSAGQVVLVGASCLGAIALAVVVTRATVAGTEALARGLAVLDQELAQREECHRKACDAAALWEHAAAQVVDFNARGAALRGMICREFGDDPDLPKPPPMTIGAKSLQEVYDECALRRAELERVQALVDGKLAEVAAKRLADSLPTLDPALVPAAKRVTARRGKPDRPAAASEVADQQIQAKINEQLDRLGAGVPAAEHARLLETAAKALAASSERAARPQLDLLRYRVDRLVQHAAKRAEQAVTAARLLEGIEFLEQRSELNERDRTVVAALQEVVDGPGTLDYPLRKDGEDLRDRAIALARRLHQTERITALLTEFGYDVSEGFATVREPGRLLNLARPDWPDHRVDLMITDGGAGGVVVRDRPVAGDDAARRDRERCEDWTADFRRIADRLRDEGVDIASLRVSSTDPVQFASSDTTSEDTAAQQALRSRTREQEQ